ncbi:MAG: Antitoxin component of bacterial toxin-antitoxin system, MqsA [Fibrobacteres bacterium]|nr:Antitoxin component of bacterial toxin-antitoxin system, MqsA [Fibrobacterota bacterium]
MGGFDFSKLFQSSMTGKELQEFRTKELDLTQKGLSDCLGVSARTVQGWEIGKSKPLAPIIRLMQLMRIFPVVKQALCPAVKPASEKP